MSYLERFYKQVTERTLENKNAFKVLFDQQLYGVCIGLLRQELDTLIRLVYINEQEDSNIKNEILKKSVEQGGWGLNKRISDAEMIEIAEEIKGWPRLVYDFGNRFIHLSGFHLYKLEEPISKIEGRELELIIRYLEEKHGFHNYGKLTFQHLLDYLPDVMQKIIENNLEELEILKVTI